MNPSGNGCGVCSHAGPHHHEHTAGPVHPASVTKTSDDRFASKPVGRIHIGAVFVTAPAGEKVWPYVDFDYAGRIREIENTLHAECQALEFESLTIKGPAGDEISRVRRLADQTDGLLVFVLATNWQLTETLLPELGRWGLPLVVVDEPYAGSGVFLCHGAQMLREGGKAVLVSSCRFRDVVEVVRCFSGVNVPGANLESFLIAAESVRRNNFALPCDMKCKPDPVSSASVEEVLAGLEASKILRVISEKLPAERALGATVETATFDEINAAYHEVDPAEAEACAERWIGEASEVLEPSRDDIRDSAAIYLAMKQLMDRHDARAITVDCLGGFYSGKLPGYPCLGYRQLNDDGLAMGTCEARVPDALAMLMVRDMFDRASFASDPVLDTSSNQIIYAHCVAPTRMLGPGGPVNRFRIRSHAEDNLGASIQSIMPTGYMTTTFGFDEDLQSMVIHQAKAVDNIDEPRACRTKLAAEVDGDIEKLFHQWDRFAWHRVTAYGDLREPLETVANELELEVVHEA